MNTEVKTMFALKREARKLLRPVYWSAFLVCLFSFVLYGYTQDTALWAGVPVTLANALQMFVFYNSPLLFQLAVILPLFFFFINPLSVGRACYFLHGVDGDWKLSHLFSSFLSLDYFRIVFVMGVRSLIISIAFIISLLSLTIFNEVWVRIIFAAVSAIIGLVVYYRHRLTPYVLAENPKQGFREATDVNKRVIHFYAGGLFFIDLSFIIWYIAGVFFFGVGQFFFMPYHETTIALRYRELSLVQSERESSYFGLKLAESPQQQSTPVVLGCIVLSITLLIGLFPTTASAYAETEIIVTTEQELRDAIEQNLSPIRIDTTITLSEGSIEIGDNKDITLRGTGTLVMEAVEEVRGARVHFWIRDSRLTLQGNLTITLSGTGFGGGVLVGCDHSFGYFIMKGGQIERIIADGGDYGGGVVIVGGVFELRDGVIRENNRGVQLNSWWRNDVFFLMTGGEISDNTDSGIGARGGHISIRGGRISGNRTSGNGGGVSISVSTTFSMDGGEISNNHARRSGGGLGFRRAPFSYENISIGSSAQFFGNTAFYADESAGIPRRPRRHGNLSIRAGLEEYPQMRWSGENSVLGTHLINNYDIEFREGIRRFTEWQISFGIIGIILVGKGIALIFFMRKEKELKLRGENALCDVEK